MMDVCVKIAGVMCSVLTAVVCAAEWTSPHSLEVEKKAPAALVPFPQEVQWQDGALALPGRSEWKLAGESGEMVQTAWKGLLEACPKKPSGKQVVCRLELRPEVAWPENAKEEGYELSISAEGVKISAVKEAGLFYGIQTLRQLVEGSKKLPYCEIRDWPSFGVRGFMHDCGRNFQTPESLKHQLDLAARLKVNYFQWHLTDDPGFHVQSKTFPALNQPKHRTRDVNDTYSYDQVRELIAYAKARHITIIPEIDMPGHSKYFKGVFGFEMGSEKGIEVLEKIIEEFCKEIPASDCPIFHFGGDETRVPPALNFVERISKKIISMGRKPMQWSSTNDLAVGADSIAQNWQDIGASMPDAAIKGATIDSGIGYTNLFDPSLLVRRWFFMRPCGAAKSDERRLGALICTWPDTRVEDKSLIPLQSAQWPGICAMAERAWAGGAGDGDAYSVDMPAPGTEAAEAYMLFENRLAALRRTIFKGEHFPYWTEKAQEWTVVEPVPENQKDDVRAKVLGGKMGELATRKAYGACLYFRTKPGVGCVGMFPKTKPGNVVWAVTTIRAAKAGKTPFMIGFDAPARSTRRYSGVPAAGEWSQCGTRIWLNGREIKNPQVYKLAGQNRCPRDTWHANEQPLSNEDVWWAHEPTLLPLKKGENTIIIEQPYIGEFQTWSTSVIPLFPPNNRK